MSSPISRRGVLGGGGALVVAFALSRGRHRAEQGGSPPAVARRCPAASRKRRCWMPGSGSERTEVTVFTGKAELGQGMKTALMQLAAEQLDVAPRASS